MKTNHEISLERRNQILYEQVKDLKKKLQKATDELERRDDQVKKVGLNLKDSIDREKGADALVKCILDKKTPRRKLMDPKHNDFIPSGD